MGGSTSTRGPATAKFRRRQPSLAEQARRKEWGRVWGNLIRNAARAAREAGA